MVLNTVSCYHNGLSHIGEGYVTKTILCFKFKNNFKLISLPFILFHSLCCFGWVPSGHTQEFDKIWNVEFCFRRIFLLMHIISGACICVFLRLSSFNLCAEPMTSNWLWFYRLGPGEVRTCIVQWEVTHSAQRLGGDNSKDT